MISVVGIATGFDFLVTGLGKGAVYALIAVGFALIYKVTGVLNFAQGWFAALFAFLPVVLTTPVVVALEIPPLAAVAVTVLAGVVVGLALERGIFRYFIGEPVLSVIVVTLALVASIEGLIQYFLGPGFRSYPATLQPDWTVPLLFDVELQASFAIAIALAVLTVGLLMLFFKYTVSGSILRAAASDQQAAMVLGVSIERTIIIAWTISLTITSIGGVLLAMSSGGASFGPFQSVGILVFAAVVLGGIDSIPGAFVGAIAIGVIEELGTGYLDGPVAPGFGGILPLILLVFIILVLPYGLFGTERIERL